jgi:hypothetical protein
MEHCRIGSFGAWTLVLTATTAVAFAAPSVAAPSSGQAVSGPYRGAYVCQTKVGVPGMFRVPIDLVIRNGNVEFSRPLLNRNATRVVGNEMASGTIDADGKMHLTSTWYNGRAVFHADYSGTLTPSGGTFMGTQTWHGPLGLSGTRTCTAALVQLAGINQSPPPQQAPADQSPTQQSAPDQSPPKP